MLVIQPQKNGLGSDMTVVRRPRTTISSRELRSNPWMGRCLDITKHLPPHMVNRK